MSNHNQIMKTEFYPKPTLEHIKDVECWLEYENDTNPEGLFVDPERIHESFMSQQILIITADDQVVGFLTYSINGLIAKIHIAWVKKANRGKGIGREFAKKCLDFFVGRGVMIAELYCSPEHSKFFWEKVGFKYFPEGVVNSSHTHMYQILVSTAGFCDKKSSNETIELWNKPDYLVNKHRPRWKWDVVRKEESNVLEFPIIQPAHDEWLVAWRKGSRAHKRIKKNFVIGMYPPPNFLIIRELGHFDEWG